MHRELGPIKPHCQFDEVIKGEYNYTAKFEGQGCTIEQMTGGIAAGDYDGDGHVDLFFTVYYKPSILYRNNGKWVRHHPRRSVSRLPFMESDCSPEISFLPCFI